MQAQPGLVERADPPVAILITAYTIGPVLTDTIQSALAQRGVDLASVLIVIDGCRYVDTTLATCQRYANAYPGRVHYIWLHNGGVSRARNVGVAWLLNTIAHLEAIYLIDGDDLIHPDAVARSMRALQTASPPAPGERIGWVYHDQEPFGASSGYLRYPKTFRRMRWAASNLSQPSCLIHRSMFDDGVFWDAAMRHGLEDWEFWYAAMERGFIGVHCPNTPLRYRRLAGNRSSVNRSKDVVTKDHMRSKHRSLVNARSFLADEQSCFPRWAVHLPASNGWRLTADPGLPGERVPGRRRKASLLMRLSQPREGLYLDDPYFPDLMAFLAPSAGTALGLLGIERLIHFLAETALETTPVCMLQLVQGAAEQDRDAVSVGFDISETPLAECGSADGLFVSTSQLSTLLDRDLGAIDSASMVDAALAQPMRIARISVALGRRAGVGPDDRLQAEVEVLSVVRDLCREQAALVPAPWLSTKRRRFDEQVCGSDKANHRSLGQEILGVWPILPLVARDGTRDIAVILPQHCGRLPDATIAMLAPFIGSGQVRLHVVATGRELATRPAAGAAAEYYVLDLDAEELAASSDKRFVDLPLFNGLSQPHLERVVGTLLPMDLVINFAGPALSGPLLTVRKAGVVTACGFEMAALFDQGDAGQVGDPLAVFAYSNCYDWILTDNENSGDLLRAYGVAASMIDVGGRQHLLPWLCDKTAVPAEDTTGSGATASPSMAATGPT